MRRLLVSMALALVAGPAFASPQELGKVSAEDFAEPKPPAGKVYSPYAGREYPDQVLFGDTHFHTNLSFDAGLVGTTLDVHAGFRFARGEQVLSNTRQPVQLVRPLDFLAITDHAEAIGLASMLQRGDPLLLADSWGKSAYERFTSGQEGRMNLFQEILRLATVERVNPFSNEEATRSIWQDFVKTADAYDEPGRFTAMTGFEWSSTPKGDNLHRIVLFADGADKTSQIVPFSMFDSEDPEDLWKFLAAYVARTGGRAISPAHNGNLSNGLMFVDRNFRGEPLTRAYVEERMRWEPLYEVTQIKGDGEAHPLLSPEDEFAGFEIWDVGNITGAAPKQPSMLPYEYGRSGLKLGLELERKIGANPFKFGLFGASDTHNGLATTREENFFGKFQHTEPSPQRHGHEVVPADDPKLRILTSQEAASGLMAVWARANTRGDIFDAMLRKEVYATTGTRIRVRVFAGWDFRAEDLHASDFTRLGYGGGVPMGGDLRKAPGGKAPSFLIRALRDPDGANLDRIQVIKGWLDAEGETHERVHDVAVSDGRTIGADGRCREPVGSTVNVEKATWTNAIGDAELATHWTDPDFDPMQSAFYYVRVLEIPTPRWTTYDAAFFGIPRPDNVPATVQDRAYTSPIWYAP
jgi:hypothetical protein